MAKASSATAHHQVRRHNAKTMRTDLNHGRIPGVLMLNALLGRFFKYAHRSLSQCSPNREQFGTQSKPHRRGGITLKRLPVAVIGCFRQHAR